MNDDIPIESLFHYPMKGLVPARSNLHLPACFAWLAGQTPAK